LTEYQAVERPLPTQGNTNRIDTHTQTPMHLVGFEPTTPVLEGAQTVYALDRVTIVIGSINRLILI
jgi:hypothetical protein